MKFYKLIIVSALVASCMIASCKKDDNVNANAIIFTASIEGQDSDNDRTSIDTTLITQGTVIWSEGDQICINNGTMTSTLGLIAGANSTRGTFRTYENSQYFQLTPPYVAAFPASTTSGSTEISKTEIKENEDDDTSPLIPVRKVTFKLPQTQDLGNNPGTFARDANPMVAKSNGTVLDFKNICGGIGIRLKGEYAGIKVTNIRIISLNPEDKLWGDLEVFIDDSDEAALQNQPIDIIKSTITNDEDNKHIIDLSCDVTLSTTEATRFFIILPVGTLANGFTLDVTYNVEGCVSETFSKTTSNLDAGNPVVVLNKLKSLPVLNITTKGQFSVSEDKKVYFSKGNLQYIGSATNPYWKFADNQWSYFGATTEQTDSDENIDRDLFGWATSGWGYICHGWGNAQTYYYHPWDSKVEKDNANDICGSGYGLAVLGDIQFAQTEGYNYTCGDWGVNAISNGGNTGGQWRTLTNSEWNYMFNGNGRGNNRFLKAEITVSSTTTPPPTYKGVILFPDNYDGSIGSYTYNIASGDYTSVSAADWSAMESAGAVFLPAAGRRDENGIDATNTFGGYWSSLGSGYYDEVKDKNFYTALAMEFFSNDEQTGVTGVIETRPRSYGYAVRLVRDVE